MITGSDERTTGARSTDEAIRWNRRAFLGGLAGAMTAALGGFEATDGAEPGPETTRIRLIEHGEICSGAPLIVAQALLRAEGFTDVRPVKTASGVESNRAIAKGEADLTVAAAPAIITQLDADEPLVILAGIHVGCFELFGNERVRSLRDLKGKKVAVSALGSGRHIFLASMVKHVGLDPGRDIDWVTRPVPEAMAMFARGDIDAFMAFPPEPQELRAKRIGHVVVSTTTDKPWSQYFCCVAVANRDFVRKHPVATKRMLRALLKAANVCAVEAPRAVQARADRGFTTGAEYALQAITELPYNRWREYNPARLRTFAAPSKPTRPSSAARSATCTSRSGLACVRPGAARRTARPSSSSCWSETPAARARRSARS